MGNKGDTMKRILVVDDVSINLRTVEKILSTDCHSQNQVNRLWNFSEGSR